ncbi:MAG: ribosome maturation factor RimM [Alphaproteobacteria bacterium]
MAEGEGARVCLGAIAGAHGVRGLVKIKSFTQDPANLTAYGPLGDESGRRRFDIAVTGQAKGLLVARIAGVEDRDAAQALRGVRLTIARAALPEPEEAEEFYQADLIGLAAEDPQGRPLGRVATVENYGAGDFLEIARVEGAPLLVPFTKVVVPLVDLEGGRVVVALPEEVEAR